MRTEHNPKAISRSTLGMHSSFLDVSWFHHCANLGQRGLSLIGESDLFPAGACFTSGSFATRSLAMVARLGCSSPVMSLNSSGGDCAPFSETRRPIFERAEILLLIQLWSLGLANLLALRIRTSGIWEATSLTQVSSNIYIISVGY